MYDVRRIMAHTVSIKSKSIVVSSFLPKQILFLDYSKSLIHTVLHLLDKHPDIIM